MSEPIARPADTDRIRTDVDGRVATVTISNPKRKNAVTPSMWGQLTDAFDWLAYADEVWAVVLTGDGEDFCAGADLSEPNDLHPLATMRWAGRAALALQALPQPTIARVDGVAVGAGLSLALGCDLLVASDRARFSEIFATRGLSLDVGSSWLLPRRVGLHKAKELALLAEIVDAAEAERIGLVNKVVPPADLDSAVAAWTDRLVSLPPLAVGQTKALLDRSSTASLAEALAAEGAAQAVNFASADTREAIAAFIEKRKPAYRGR